ncbi:MAG: hypothetical protein QXI97_00875 [Nitrososphaerota archaeon]
MGFNSRSSRSGLSNIVALVFGVAIVFVSIMPLNIYMQNLKSAYDSAVEQRLIYDSLRLKENLDTIAYPEVTDNNLLVLNITNVSEVPVLLKRVFISYNSSTGPNLQVIGVDVMLMQGDKIRLETGFQISEEALYYVKVSTARGNIFNAVPYPIAIGLEDGQSVFTYPYALTVTIKNMRPGKEYTFRLEGNVPYAPYSLTWKATGSNKDQTLAFGVNPGQYLLTLIGDPRSPPCTISIAVPDILTVIFDLDLDIWISCQYSGYMELEIESPDDVSKGETAQVTVRVTNFMGGDVSGAVLQASLVEGQGWNIQGSSSKNLPPMEDGETETWVFRLKAPNTTGSTATVRVDLLINGVVIASSTMQLVATDSS